MRQGAQIESANVVNILLIEDNAGDARLLQETLRDTDLPSTIFNFRHASLMARAVSMLEDEDSAVVLLDLSLPDGKGLENVARIKRQSPNLPIIVLTGTDDEKLAVQALQEGVQDYLVKGQFDGGTLVRSIRYSIERQNILAELEEARKIEHQLAYHDNLTGLPNRVLFYDRLEQSIALAKRQKTSVAVLFLDLDGFKNVNDTLGHGVGDLLLQTAAKRLQSCLRESDTSARIGGDEFTAILTDLPEAKNACIVADKIKSLFRKPIIIEGNELFVSTSIGISIFPKDGHTTEELVKNADIAMYLAKSNGKNGYQMFNYSMGEKTSGNIQTEGQLRRAIGNDELVLHYQPLVDTKSGEIQSVEALLRWEHPTRGLIPPGQFIGIAEETGLIVEIGNWVLGQVCSPESEFLDLPIKISINLSARQFKDHKLTRTICDNLSRSIRMPENIIVEITENSAMQNVDVSVDVLHELKELGVKIALDDFGTGYSSLSYLKRLPIDMLKIDRSFIKGIPQDRDDISITTAIIALAHSLDLEVIAEGVETREQSSFLQNLNCEKMQGYYYSKPVPAAELAALFKADKRKIDLPPALLKNAQI